MKTGECKIPVDKGGVSRVRLGGLERRMRDRWRTITRLWEKNKSAANKLDLLGQLDYFGKLSSQLEWQGDTGTRNIRVLYNGSGAPTAALLEGDNTLVDYTLFWITCKELGEAHYLLSIINSDKLREAVTPLMPKGQFGARHLQKHLWKLPIPEFDADVPLHVEISEAGKAAATGAAQRLSELRAERGDNVSVTIARRELRAWLRTSPEGAAVEGAVGRLLG